MISFLLTAPALFFWGLGTSNVAQQSFQWSDPSSSAAMAVATIVIPALDAFFGSQLIGDWYDKVSLVDAPWSASVASRGRWDGMERRRCRAVALAFHRVLFSLAAARTSWLYRRSSSRISRVIHRHGPPRGVRLI